MNAVEIEEAVSELATQPFDAGEFAFQFLAAFGMKDTTVKRLRTGSSNSSDVAGGVLQRSNIHIATSPAGQVGETLAVLRASPKTTAAKAKFILSTDGDTLEAEDLTSGEAIACEYADLPQHFGFFLPLAGISTVTEIKNNPIDIKATGRLNKLYVELLKENPDWGTREKRPALNQFMARLIFCFFAEDTSIFLGEGLFTSTVARMSTPGHGSGEERWGNTHEVLAELFRSMATDTRHNGQLDDRHRKAAGIKGWADVFPYVNGGLFSGSVECPKFSRIARSYLLRAGELSWKEINPDIFGSMIQAVADDDERGELGMHYTSVPNILKVLNPLFLDDLREQLEAAGANVRKLRNLRKRIAGIRVFDPACGSGNFLVIAYLKMREIEHEVVQRTGDNPRSLIRLTNFYGIEIKSFAVEIARLSLLIAEFQADCRYISQQEARAMVLPLHRTGQIHQGNALRLEWDQVCPAPEGSFGEVQLVESDLAGPTGKLALDSSPDPIAVAETYICGNPPFAGQIKKTQEQRDDMEACLSEELDSYKNLDFVACWYFQAARYNAKCPADFAFVSTNSIAQGRQVHLLWPHLLSRGVSIWFACRPFKWKNNARGNAGVTCVIVGMSGTKTDRTIFDEDNRYEVDRISGYLSGTYTDPIGPQKRPLSSLPSMNFGSMPNDGGNLLLDRAEYERLSTWSDELPDMLRRFIGADELINRDLRYCIWMPQAPDADMPLPSDIKSRIASVAEARAASSRSATRELASVPYRFGEVRHVGDTPQIVIPAVSSEGREYLPVALVEPNTIISNRCFVIPDCDLVSLSLIASTMHRVWIDAVCGKLEQRYNYSNTLGWNTFPVPRLTEQNKADLRRSAEDILLAREAHFPASIADLYEPDLMPEDLRRAHEANDAVLERIYIGRLFRNDTERLEKLFELYTKMTANESSKKAKRAA